MGREESSIRGEAALPTQTAERVAAPYAPPERAAGGSSRPASSTPRSSSTTSTTATKTATGQKSELDLRELAMSYGLLYDEIQAIPELKALFQKAVEQGYSATRFTAELKNTAWWRETPDIKRKYLDLQFSDPATFRVKQLEFAGRVNDLAVQIGLGDLGGRSSDDFAGMNQILKDGATHLFADGWSEDRLKSWLGGQVSFQAGIAPGGEAGRVYNQVHALAYSNGRSYGQDWYTQQMRDVVGGRKTLEQVEQVIRREAAADYKAFSAQILAGQNAMDLAAPYLRTVSTLLEKPDGAMTLDDPLMRKAMTTANKDGSAYGVWQLENDVRSDARWRQTNNARESLMKLGHAVLSDFGLTF